MCIRDRDWKAPTMKVMLNVVKVIDSVVSERGCVLVHCHAGMGRTGLAIGCYLLYSGKYEDVGEVMRLVKEKRNKAFSNNTQINFIQVFNELLKELRVLFPAKAEERISLKEFLTKQNYLLHGPRKRQLKHCPILLAEICERVCTLRAKDIVESKDIAMGVIGRAPDFPEVNRTVKELKLELDKWNWQALYDCKSLTALIQLALDFLDSLSLPVMERVPESAKDLFLNERKVLETLLELLKSDFQKTVEAKDYKGTLYRLAISLLGLRNKEAKCFLGRELVDWNFTNTTLIEGLKNCMEELLSEEAKSTHKIILEPNLGVFADRPSPTRSELNFTEYSQCVANLSRLPEKEQSKYVQKFEELFRELEMKSSSYSKSELLTPQTMLATPSKYCCA
eukprot:TRINITY_DN9661_c0_g1_i6.p1 TRINITY_DN9661_c0_g1~~TRINITY_DN9661_c0_g1_i6.p1  ORF type:complete len:394 (-),score=96.59 TRINITY_DN9661_c0_g1_i6:185-1366(-)